MSFMKASRVRRTCALGLDPENVREYLALEEVYLGMLAYESLETLQSDRRTPTDNLSINFVYESAYCL